MVVYGSTGVVVLLEGCVRGVRGVHHILTVCLFYIIFFFFFSFLFIFLFCCCFRAPGALQHSAMERIKQEQWRRQVEAAAANGTAGGGWVGG